MAASPTVPATSAAKPTAVEAATHSATMEPAPKASPVIAAAPVEEATGGAGIRAAVPVI